MSGVQSQALDSIKEKLNDAEMFLQHEKQSRARFEVDHIFRTEIPAFPGWNHLAACVDI